MRRPAKFGICAACKNGFEIITHALNQPYDIAFVATCERDDSPYEEKIAALCEQHGVRVLRKVDANAESFIHELARQQLDLIFLAWWPAIIRQSAIAAVKQGWVNLHPSLLPHCRGKHPYYWAIVEGKPFGVTLHFIDANIDSGDILFQEQIEVLPTDTGESLYRKADEACVALFKNRFDAIVHGEYHTRKQDASKASMHYAKEIVEHSRIDLDKAYQARELLDIIRARTFWQGDSAYFYLDGKKYLVRIDIKEAKD